ncbi:putative major facilitator superfamily transporter [Streptomyces sp. NBRC 110611]|uniref:MDR family MFS transporter n=1 Tax=Streptomyces sp. NBRC 110611 TaxID=1621259 RepID=UPI0008304A11|nr:MFS transporter [Streptomyces sp. NBRC 110611]GAU64741.1 putative major facilitator superfamily transporter [Streptomyces sp. NBRC 110611]
MSASTPPRARALARLKRAATESVSGLPRQFWWLWTSTLINRLGAFVATFLALYLTVERGFSPSYAGLVGALYGLGGVISSVGAGVLTDRLGRRPTMLIAQLSTAASVALLGFLEHPVAIAVVASVVGMATNASRPAVQAMMADIVAPEDRVRAYSLNYWAINLGFAISATAAGLIAEHGYLVLFLGEATLVLACAVVVFCKLPESRPTAPATADGRNPSGSATDPAPAPVSMLTVLRDGRFMTVVALNLLLALLFQQAYVSLPVSMSQNGFSSADFGSVAAINGVLIVLLQIPVTRFIEHRSPATLLIGSSLLTGYGFGLTALADSVAVYGLTVAIWTLGEIINSPTQMGLVVRLSPVHGRGRYQGMYALSWSIASLTAPLLGGTVIDHLGSGVLWAGCAAVGTVAAAGYGLLLRNLPKQTKAEAETATSSTSTPTPTPTPPAPPSPASASASPAAPSDSVT